MRLGFLGGAIFATWLTLTYPAEMSAVFENLTAAVEKLGGGSSDLITPEKN